MPSRRLRLNTDSPPPPRAPRLPMMCEAHLQERRKAQDEVHASPHGRVQRAELRRVQQPAVCHPVERVGGHRIVNLEHVRHLLAVVCDRRFRQLSPDSFQLAPVPHVRRRIGCQRQPLCLGRVFPACLLVLLIFLRVVSGNTTGKVRQVKATVGALVSPEAAVAEVRARGRRYPAVCAWCNEEKAVEFEEVFGVAEVEVEQFLARPETSSPLS